MTTANSERYGSERGWLARRLALGAAMFAFWVLLTWPPAPGGELLVGLVVAAGVALIMRDLVTQRVTRLLNPARYFWALAFVCVLAIHVIRANLDVALRVLRPSMPIRPGIVRMRTSLATDSARTALACAITLTPGTLTVDVTGDGRFYVHWIDVGATTDEEAARHILGRFEWLIRRILE